MDLNRQKIVQSLTTWVIAAVIAGVLGVIAVVASWYFVNERGTEPGRPCEQRPCFVVMDTRLKDMSDRLLKVESKSHPSTSKRFDRDDATALELRMIKCHNRPDWHTCLDEERVKYERSKGR